MQDDQEPLLQL